MLKQPENPNLGSANSNPLGGEPRPSNPGVTEESSQSRQEAIKNPGLADDVAILPDPYGSDGDKDDRKRRATLDSNDDKQKRLDRFLYNRDLSMFPDDYLIINDIFLGDVPTSSIRIEKDTEMFIVETLRSEAPIVQPLGRNNITLSLTLAFKPGPTQSNKLHRLVSELRYNPLVYIYNNKIRKSLGVGVGLSGVPLEAGEEETSSTIFILDTATLRNDPNHIGVMVLDLVLHYFNYKPYSKHFWYNATLPGVTNQNSQRETEERIQEIEHPLDLTELQGYEASGYSLDINSERLVNKVKAGILNEIDPTKANNFLPTPFPYASDAWMYYADHLAGLVPSIPDYPSDFLGFEVEKLEQYNPPNDASRIGNNGQAAINSLGLYFEPSPIYSADAQAKNIQQVTASDRKASKTDASRRQAEKIRKSKSVTNSEYSNSTNKNTITEIEFEALTTGYTERFKFDENGLSPEDRIRFCQNFSKPIDKKHKDPAGNRTWSEEQAISEELAKLLFDVGTQWPGRKVIVTSLVRAPGRATSTSEHAATNANAIDLGIRGVSREEIFKWGVSRVSKLKKGAAIYYADNRFVHLDGRTKRKPFVGVQTAEEFNPANYEGGVLKKYTGKNYKAGDLVYLNDKIGQSARTAEDLLPLLKLHMPDLYTFFTAMSDLDQIDSGEDGEADDDRHDQAEEAAGGDNQQANDVAAAKNAETANKVATNAEQKKQKASAANRDSFPITTDSSTKDPEARERWIEKIEQENNVSYYRKDPAISNLFIRRIRLGVSSDPLLRNNPSFLSNIVCSGVSVTFGHRICPLKLLGQDTPTWQFLGAGNKTGSIALTYSGREGKKAAAYLIKMVQYSHENARKYSALIPESGSIDLIHNNWLNREVNSILALLGIEKIAVTNIEESSIPGTADQHQLIIQFINQELKGEGLKRQYSTPLNTKRRLISFLMGYLKNPGLPAPITRPQALQAQRLGKAIDRTLISPKIGTKVSGSDIKSHGVWDWFDNIRFNTWIYNKDYPIWLIEAINKTQAVTQTANDESPPSAWKLNVKQTHGPNATARSYEGLDTWKDRYDIWGAGDLVLGQVSNIGINELNDYLNHKQGGTNTGIGQEFFGRFQHDGGIKTNSIASRVYNNWLRDMDIIIKEVLTHMTSDPEAFDKYFGEDIRKEALSALTQELGECYEDMNLPLNPNAPSDKALSLPPEFYIYNDALEGDPAATGEKSQLKEIAMQFMRHERQSLFEVMSKRILGGSYVSINMDKIIANRAGWNENFGAEWGFHWGNGALYEGARTWDPVFYRPHDPSFDNERTKAWAENLTKSYGADSAETTDVQAKFLEKIIAMNTYLNEGRRWNTNSIGGNKYRRKIENEELVNQIYGENANQMLFGPNIRFGKADKVLDGQPLNIGDRTVRDQDIYDDAIKYASASGNRAIIRSDARGTTSIDANGSVTIMSKTELENTLSSIFNRSSDSELSKQPIPILSGSIPSSVGKGAKKSAEAVTREREEKVAADEEMRRQETAGEVANLAQNSDHFLSSRESKEEEDLAEVATGIVLGRKLSDLSVRRTFPTFKIYFIEDDQTEDEVIKGAEIVRAFDDFYSYSSIQEIKITRSRKIPGDLAIIRMTNIGGKLLRRRFGEFDLGFNKVGSDEKTGKVAEYSTGIHADTELEHPFERMILQDGVKVQIRLGYAANPDHLESVFLGEIVEVGPSEDQRMLEIVCQGYGAELDAVEMNPLADGSVYYSSQAALSAAIISPYIINFGRQRRSARYNPAEIRSRFTGSDGRGFMTDIFSPGEYIRQFGQADFYALVNKNRFLNKPQDDNIYAPPPSTYTSWWERFWDNACIYRPIKQTAWDIFKEHELRHPGYASLAVPYGHTGRMTMFFGPRYQHYWSAPVSPLELYLAENAESEIVKLQGIGVENLKGNTEWTKLFMKLAKENSDLALAIYESVSRSFAPLSVGFQLGRMFGRYKPFRNFFHMTSENHIIANEIRTSRDGTFNEVEIRYFDDEEDIDPSFFDKLANEKKDKNVFESVPLIGGAVSATQVAVKDWIGTDTNEAEVIVENLQKLEDGSEGVLTVQLDENIPQEYIRSYTGQFPSCVTDYMAQRYAQGLFVRFLKDSYKGTITVTGNEEVKPYDIIYIDDRITNMRGPVEVEAVTHVFNREWGFITMVTPDLCVSANEFWTTSTADLIGTMFTAFGERGLGSAAAGTVVELASMVTNPLAYLAAVGGIKFVQWTQDGAPVVATPLSLGGRPFISTVLGPHSSSIFGQMAGKWAQLWDDTSNWWDKFNLGEYLFTETKDFQTNFAKWVGNGDDLEEF